MRREEGFAKPFTALQLLTHRGRGWWDGICSWIRPRSGTAGLSPKNKTPGELLGNPRGGSGHSPHPSSEHQTKGETPQNWGGFQL